jgi:ketosteroid isomerase-like protein
MEDVRSLIASVNRNFMGAFSRGDAGAIAALYTDDAKLLPPSFPMMTGKEAVQSFWQGAMNSGVTEAKLETLELESQGNLASEIGRFTLTVQLQGSETTTMTGKYLVVWKNQDENWKLHVDIWNTDEA